MSIGERLKLRRHYSGLSLRALADKVEVSAQAISKYERGLDVPSSAVLLRLGEALDVKTEYFFRQQQLSFDPTYRKRVALRKKDERAVLGQVRDGLERYLDARALFPEEEGRRTELPREPLARVAAVPEVEQTAVELRKRWDLGLDPIENFTQLLEDKGVYVQLVTGDRCFDGCAFWANDDIPVMAIKDDLPGDRQRFNLAHELAHLVLDFEPGVPDEKAAHRFAGAFLVPKAAAEYELGGCRRSLDARELHLLKHKYGLSMQAWIYRAKDLEIISDATAVRLFREYRMKGWHVREPGDQLPGEEPGRLAQLVLRALNENIISDARAAELLGQPLADFLADQARLHDLPDAVCG